MNAESGWQTKCAAVKDLFPLYLYGELSFDEEEGVESHLDECVDCRKALDRMRELHAAFDRVAVEPSIALLRECREDLRLRLAEEQLDLHSTSRAAEKRGWWDQFVDLLTLGPSRGSHWLRPAGALTLIAIGFAAARVIPPGALSSGGGFASMSMTEPAASRVRYVEPASDGKIHIVLDETRQRILSGSMEDQSIRALLLAAAKDPSDPGLRANTVDILNTRAQLSDVRNALIYALNDKNVGVRSKALQGLAPFAQEPAVLSALASVLRSDANPGMRTQAIDLLTKGINQNSDRQLIGTLQELMERDNNNYVRQRCRVALESAKASTETF